MQQEHPMCLLLAESKSSLQESLVEPKVPTGVSINLLPKVDRREFPCTNEVHDGIPSSSSKANESKEPQDDYSKLKSNTTSSIFEASTQQEYPMSLMLNDKKGDLQGISVEQNVPIGDYAALSPNADSSELSYTIEVPHGFSTSSNEAYESKESQDDSITTETSEVNACVASQSLLRLSEGVHDYGKVTCEAPSAILKRAKEDKPLVAHLFRKRQMSLGDTRHKVPAPLSRSNTGKYLRMDKFLVDTTTPIESVKAAASKFGGSINWKTRRAQTAQESDHIVLELDKLKTKISECKHQAENAEAAKFSVLNELERTKKLIDEMKRVLDRQRAEEVDAKEDLELFRFILQEMEEGVAFDDVVVIEKLNNALVAKAMLVKGELRKVQEDYDSLLIETDISIRKAQAAFAASKDAEKQVEELTVELQGLKAVLDLAHATCQDAKERKKNTLMACDKDRLAWGKDLRQAHKELNQISTDLSAVQELQSQHNTSSSLLFNLKNELAACLEAKLIEEAQEQDSRTHKSMQEIIILSRNELEEHRKSIAKVTDELCSLKALSASLKSELNKEKTALKATQQMEAMAFIAIQSLKVDIKTSQQELESVRGEERQDKTVKLPKVIEDASQETDKAKSVAAKAREELRKTKEEVELQKAALSTTEFRLEAVLRDIEAVRESERLALNTLRALEDSKVAVNVEQQGSSQMITLDSNDYTSLIHKTRQAEVLVHKEAAAIAQVEAAKESESRTLSRLNETVKALKEQKQALAAATEQADRANEGKLAMEQELRKWREENGKRRRKAGEASKPEAKPSSTAEIVGGDTNCTSKDDCCASSSVHPLSDESGRSSPNDLALQPKTKKAKKLSFFPRIIMFLGRRRLKAAT
ncbi:hypothetical protein U9M48_006347 [Paspalum notatum var. saurae]|uniref:Uncharacterized protein n=1 Tax=Paspalum notatum var. saurae TaxID=547442 RepID=A0AAQ3PXN6_PASNO